jgi:U3 small nucleolar RNA-associated protein 5
MSNEGAGNVAIAFGTHDSKIEIFSPSEAKLVGTLKDIHTQGIRDFKFVDHGLHAEAWSVGGDGRLVQWDLKNGEALR